MSNFKLIPQSTTLQQKFEQVLIPKSGGVVRVDGNPILRDILKFRQEVLEIDDKHLELGGDTGLLGTAISDVTASPDSIGFFRKYSNGMIYYTPSTGAHEIHGAILERYLSLGGELSFLGYLVSDEGDLGVANGRFSNFQHGQIAWSLRSGSAVSSAEFFVHTGGGIRPQGLPANGEVEIRRFVVVSAHMDITDSETFGSDEHQSEDKQTNGFVTNRVPSNFLPVIGRAGGEVRIEVNVSASIITSDGDIKIDGEVVLFEGTSAESDDRDGSTPINFAVPRDSVISQAITVRNTDEGGDFADIRLVISNFAA